MFRVYDYTNATRLFGAQFLTRLAAPKKVETEGEDQIQYSEPAISVQGFDVHVTDAGRYILTMVDGKAMPVTVEEYKQLLAAKLVSEVATLDSLLLLVDIGSGAGARVFSGVSGIGRV